MSVQLPPEGFEPVKAVRVLPLALTGISGLTRALQRGCKKTAPSHRWPVVSRTQEDEHLATHLPSLETGFVDGTRVI